MIISTILSIIILIAVASNFFFTLREGRDERGRAILDRAASIAFSFLIMCYCLLNLIRNTISSNQFHLAIDIIFAASLVYYIVRIVIQRKRYS